tara:strand:- start:468 stop:701 length:234 start_codon:yes stop_codon:yes gene_type:complete
MKVGDLIQRKIEDDHYWRHPDGLEGQLYGIIVELGSITTWGGAMMLREAKICWSQYGVSWHPIDRLENVSDCCKKSL